MNEFRLEMCDPLLVNRKIKIDSRGNVRSRHYVEPKGYAGRPGTGPEGKNCKDCNHYYLKRMSKSYPKCNLNRHNWTGGRGSDILAGSPACYRFEANE
jgi:hypothetical protein